jgi:N-acetylglucosamine malate deacetylase 1
MHGTRLRHLFPRGFRRRILETLLPPDPGSAPVLVSRGPAGRIAVLSPHPDDDVIGCGGTLCKHCLAGDSVTVITLTDGARGMNHAAPPSLQTAETRRAEARNASGLLGIRDRVFLDLPDGALSADAETVGRLIEELDRLTPHCVFLPFLLDGHRDHRAANRLFAAAVRRTRRPMEVYAYEVWTPLPANRLVDISTVAAIKERAIRMHVSQAGRMDYAAAAMGLNRFRSLSVSGGKGSCEAFFSMDAGRYADLVERTLGRRSDD